MSTSSKANLERVQRLLETAQPLISRALDILAQVPAGSPEAGIYRALSFADTDVREALSLLDERLS